MSIEKSNGFISIRCLCGNTVIFKAPGSEHRIGEPEAENARTKDESEKLLSAVRMDAINFMNCLERCSRLTAQNEFHESFTHELTDKLERYEAINLKLKAENEKLRKLDENVKEELAVWRAMKAQSEIEQEIIPEVIELLESLYE